MAKTTKPLSIDEQDASIKIPKAPKSVKSKTKNQEVTNIDNSIPSPVLSVELTSEVPLVSTEEKVKKARSSKKAKEFALSSETILNTESTDSNIVTTENIIVEQENDEIVALSTEFSNKLNQVFSALSVLRADYKNLERRYMKELKASQKLNFRKKRKANRAPSGFVKPTKISTELATFLDKPIGFEMARTEVTREINKYIRANNLQDSVNGRKINPNPALAKLLKIAPTDELTYFNLQRFMSPHFQKLNSAPLSESAPLAV